MPELNNTIIKNSANLKMYLRFEGNSTDSSTGGFNGTDTSITYNASYGKFGQGAYFDGTNSKIAIGDNDIFSSTNFSLLVWVYPDLTSDRIVISKYQDGSTANSEWYIQINTTGVIQITGNGTNVVSSPSGTVVANQWQQIGITLANTDCKIIYNGGIKASGTINRGSNTTSAVNIGTDTTGARKYKGNMDEVIFYDSVLSADQIKELYEGRYVGEGWPQAGLVAGYHLNGSSTDFSGNNNHGTDTAITYSLANGKFNQGAGFNGSSSKIALPSGMARLYNTVTIAGWINIGALLGAGGVYQITNEWGASTRNYLIYIDENEKINFIVGNGTSSQDATLTTTTTLSVGSWYYLSCVINGTTHDLYLNGNKEATQVGSYQGGSTAAARWIGVDSAGTAQFFNGKMDELQFFNVAKDANWVRKQYAWAKGFYI